jgi:hypothetical protein
MVRRELLWIRLAVALVVEFLFLAFVLPECARDSTYKAEVWKDFLVAGGAVLVGYVIWPAVRRGGGWLRLAGLALGLFPAWVLGWVLLQHFGIVPRWFS